MKLEVGQKLVIQLVGNAARYKRGDQLIEHWVVVKVGRKYFYAARDPNLLPTKFEISTGRNTSQSSLDYQAWESESDLMEYLELKALRDKLRETFSHWGEVSFRLDQLREVARILEIQM